MKKVIKYILLLVVIALVGYKSVYFKKLSTMGVGGVEKFDAVAYTNKLWKEKLPAKLDSAIALTTLLSAIRTNPDQAFQQYSNSLAIGNYRYSLVKFMSAIDSVNDNEISVHLANGGLDSSLRLKLATEFIYGNAIRDASGLVDIRDFTNTTDLNNISEEMNKKVRKELVPEFKASMTGASGLEVTGAVKFNKAHLDFKELEIIPLRMEYRK